jgi:PhnB protein
MPVGEMFWGDRCGTIIDPEGNPWMIATHVAEPTPGEMKKKMKQMMSPQAGSAASS